MTNFEEGREYRLVLNSVPPEAAGAVVAELVRLFPIEAGPAKGIVKAAPIVLVDKLTPEQARNAESHLGYLRRLGADVTVTSDHLSSVKRMTLPVKPDIVRRPGNVFICPTCGDRLVVCSEGSVKLAHTPAAEEPAPAQHDAAQEPVPKPSPSGGAAPAGKVVRKSWPKVAADEATVRRKAETAKGAPGSEASSVESPAVTPKTQNAAGEIPKRIEPASEAPAPAEPEREEPAGKPKAPSEGEEVAILEPGAPGKPSEAEGEVNCRVSLDKKLKRSQRKTVSELIAKYQDIPLEEAVKATKKSLVTILRNATREKAEECKQECKELGISVQISER